MLPNTTMLICLAIVGLPFACAPSGDSGELAPPLIANAKVATAAVAGATRSSEFPYVVLPELLPFGACMPAFTLKDDYPTKDLLESKLMRRIPTPVNQQTKNNTVARMAREISIAKSGGLPLHPDAFYLWTVKPVIDRLVQKCYAELFLSEQRIVQKRDSSIPLKLYQAQCQQKGCSYFQYISHSFKGCRDQLRGATNPAIYLDSIYMPLRDPTHVSFEPKIRKHSVYYEFKASCTKKGTGVPLPGDY